jgi:hypothetical protein
MSIILIILYNITALFNGAKLCINVFMADTLSELGSGICPYTNKRSNTKYGLQQNINAENRNNA